MQETRQHILEILREVGPASVDTIVDKLRSRRGDDITAVTVRHHLARLQEDKLITSPQLRHRKTPGRPQHVYALTESAQQHFPDNYRQLAGQLVKEIQAHLPPPGVNVIFEAVADTLAAHAKIGDRPLRERLDLVVSYLTQQGYSAYWESCDEGYVLHTRNCPYHDIAKTTEALCVMDIRLVSALLGTTPRMISRVAEGDSTCAYLISAGSQA